MRVFFKTKITYLGHIFSSKGIERDHKKTAAIMNWAKPVTVTDVCSFLGFTNYYMCFIPKYAQVAQPLHVLTSGENSTKEQKLIDWTPECQAPCDNLKRLCSSAPILVYADCGKSFWLHTDASTSGLGAVLCQRQDDGTDHVITYASCKLSKAKRKYDAPKLELLALKWCISE